MSDARKVMWVALAAGLLLLPFLSLPGRYVFDTRDSLWFHPAAYLSRALVLWRPSPYLGHEQHEGIAIPMGIVVWLLRSAGLSMWVAERLWHGLLLFTAATSTILLVDGLRGQKTVLAPVAAGLAYSLTPYSFGYGLPISAVYLPYVLLPLLLLITLKGLSDRRLVWPALFGLTTFLMGGGNGAPQAYVLLTAGALVAWTVAIDRSASFRRAITFLGISLLFVVGMNAYWLFLLGSSEVSNALSFSEQPGTINISSSASEAIRGLGFWQFYGGDQFGPWVPAVRSSVTSLPLILAGFAIPVGAIVSAWLVRWRHRLFFLLVAVISVFVAGGIFPVSSPTPFGRALLWMYDHVPGVAGLRTTYKVTAQVNLGFALLFAFGLAALWKWAATLRRPGLVRGAAVALALAVIAGNAYPLWAAKLYNPARGVEHIPGYWEEALRQLDRRDPRYRVFFAPAATWATYRWGAIKEGTIGSDPVLQAINPRRLPVEQGYGSNLVAAVERPYLDGLPAAGSAQLMRYLGVRFVVLQNDLDWQRSHTARPASLQTLLKDPELAPFASFGVPEQAGPPGSATSNDSMLALERSLPPVQVLAVANPSEYVRAEGPDPIVISGDGYGIAAAAAQGLLRGNPPLLYSGSLTSAGLDSLLDQAHPSFIITDSNRRRVWSFTGPKAPHSYTLPAGQTISGRGIGYRLFDDRETTQSLAVYPGARSIAASGYGSLFGSEPQYRPANAFDHDPSTLWAVGAGRMPVGQWIQVVFDQPRILSSVKVSIPRFGWRARVTGVRLEFSNGSSVIRSIGADTATMLSFSARRTAFLRLRIVGVTRLGTTGQPGAAIGDIEVPGLDGRELIRVPTDLFDIASGGRLGRSRLSGVPIAYLFERARGGTPRGADEEAGILRRFEVAAPVQLSLSGSVRLNATASDDQVDTALLGDRPVQVTSSSRLFGDPRFRGSSAFDGNPATSWVPAGTRGEWLTATFPAHTIDHLAIHTVVDQHHSSILELRATFSDGSTVTGQMPDPTNGNIAMAFPARSVSSVTLSIEKIFSVGSARPEPVAISEVDIPDVLPIQSKMDASLACSVGVGFSIDHVIVPVQPAGTVGDLLAGRSVPLGTCGGRPVELQPGWHDLVARGALEPDSLSLATHGFGHPLQARPRPPALDFSARADGGFDVTVTDAHGPYYLVIGQNFDPGWQARIDGADLGAPMLLDGYSAGWRVDRTGSYVIEVRYGPQRTYTFALLATGVTVVMACSIVAGHLVRRRRRGARAMET